MKELLYKKENNLFQSLNWLAFQENYGRKLVHFSNCTGIELELPFSRKAVWIQKAPGKISDKLIDEIKETKADFVRFEPLNIPQKIDGYKKVTENSLLSGQKSPMATQLIDISGTEEELFSKMKSKTRYNIRLSVRKGVTVKATDNEDVLYHLLSKTAKRQSGYSLHPKEYYTKLIKDLSKNDVAKVFVAYDKDLNPVSAILVSFFGEVATYLHGGFSEEDKSLMAPYPCHVEAIKYAKKLGCKYYDMWGVAETNNPKDPWAGITRFKQGFGGEKIIFAGSYDYVNSKFWYNLLTIMSRARKVF